MTRMTRRPLFVLMAALAAALGILSASRSGAEGTVPGHVLARLKTGVDAKALANQYGSAILDYISATQTYSLKDPVGMTEATFVARLVADSRVAWAQIDTYLFSGIQSSPNTQYHYAF